MRRLARFSPLRMWARSLPFRVVVLTLGASIVILAATGFFLLDQSGRGVMEGKTQASVAEASAVVQAMQRDLTTTDLRTTSVNERVTRLAREAAGRGQFGNQYFVVVETPVSQVAPEWLDPSTIPENIRNSVASGDGLWSTPTLIRFTDDRPGEPGLVVGTNLQAPGQQPYPVFFIFSTAQERATLTVVQQRPWPPACSC